MRLIEILTENNGKMPEAYKNDNPDLNIEIAGLTSDSRLVENGFLFAALPGSSVDGSKFIDDAIGRGARVVLAGSGVRINSNNVQLLHHPKPRQQFSKMAARFYYGQPETVAAITGTNGKTSVAFFLEQIWTSLGIKSASLGTLGLHTTNPDMQEINQPGSHTTPDPVKLHQTLSMLAKRGVSNLAIEASSHGIEQFRLDGMRIKLAAFTNISRDHLDYHKTMQSYMDAKLRLFTNLVSKDGVCVINADRPEGLQVADACKAQGIKTFLVGKNGSAIRIISARPEKNSHLVKIEIDGVVYEINLPLTGLFQVENAMLALGLAIAGGLDTAKCVAAVERLRGVPGRMQIVSETTEKSIFVDYAHTPDALQTVLQNLRPHTAGKLIVVFGAGGDRDPGKRALMGDVATTNADLVVVTDDNPRSEDPASIRAAIMQSAPGAIEIGNRAEAIRFGISSMKAGDVLLIAGKGHEQGQIIGSQTIPFDDALEVKKAIAGVAE